MWTQVLRLMDPTVAPNLHILAYIHWSQLKSYAGMAELIHLQILTGLTSVAGGLEEQKKCYICILLEK